MSADWNSRQGAAALAAVSIPAGYAWFRWKYPTLIGDLQQLGSILFLYRSMVELDRSRTSMVDVFEKTAQERPDHPCILFEEDSYCYADVSRRVSMTARWISGSDPSLKKGDAVCVLLHNGPTFLWTWLGLLKLGVISSLINYNLRGTTLLHCIRTSEAKKLIFGSEFLPIVCDILPDLRQLGIDLLMVNDTGESIESPPNDVVTMDIDTVTEEYFPSVPISSLDDVVSYIFTSGTTGMPKPAVVTHKKAVGGGMVLKKTYNAKLHPDDVYYVPLPLYHSSALLIVVCGSFTAGCTIAIARKFSASRFWDDIRKYKVTIFQYIGELCRYLLAQPAKENDGVYEVPLRAAVGNGLRVEIWKEFQTRFNIGRIIEFYGATEAITSFINVEGRVGSVGKYPWTVRKFFDNIEVVAYDFATGQPKRDGSGMCIRLPAGEPGLLLMKMMDRRQFAGYKGKREMSEKKIVRNVKVPDDMYFNSGDVMRIDSEGYVYFIDRVGDTYRWKGENVSTFEVSHVLSCFPDIEEANVYGVYVPGHDGRAGMAAIVVRKGAIIDYGDLYRHVTSSLPTYAQPKFLRMVGATDLTSTFKHKKSDLVKRGFNPDFEEVFIVEPSQETYVPITQRHIQALTSGYAKL
ncbi:long-chain fatty acid transport protein 2-like [Diadema antillarum]|uniref:long-chain fatty acid transport protein 2-like n=1 Tax=Diadema antillarum TaxID=105358 RepID=UPI003A892F74